MGKVIPFRRRTRWRARPVQAPVRKAAAARWRLGPANPAAVLAVVAAAGLAVGVGWEAIAPSVPSAPLRAAHEKPEPVGTVSGRVVRVIDGDTFRLDCCGASIRLWGIDAPERNTPAGPAATAALRSLIAGQRLSCTQHATDRYGRIVGQCALTDGADLGARLLATGTVREYCHFSRNHYRTC